MSDKMISAEKGSEGCSINGLVDECSIPHRAAALPMPLGFQSPHSDRKNGVAWLCGVGGYEAPGTTPSAFHAVLQTGTQWAIQGFHGGNRQREI